MSKSRNTNPARADRFVWRDGDVTVRRAPGKRPLAKPGPGPRSRHAGAGLPLGTVRRSRELTQIDVAERLGVDQAQVSRLEARGDAKLSTVLDYLNSIGGRDVELAITFDDGERVTIPLRHE